MSTQSYDPNFKADRQIETPIDTQRYSDEFYDYICEAAPDTKLDAPAWRVSRIALDGSSERFARGGRPECPAADLATVQALFA